jgi:hypothetical protein
MACQPAIDLFGGTVRKRTESRVQWPAYSRVNDKTGRTAYTTTPQQHVDNLDAIVLERKAYRPGRSYTSARVPAHH